MSSTMPPPTGGGNAKYVIIAVLLLGGIVGLVVWRSSGKNDGTQPVVIRTLDAGTRTIPRIEDEVPPPPPIPDAGPDTGPKMMTGTPAGNGAYCTAPQCSGSVTPDLESALQFRARQARRCYEAALESDNTLKGKVAISVRVASNGQVCSAGVASNELGNAAVAQCVANKFRQAGFFPAPKGGCIDTNVPITFVPGGR